MSSSANARQRRDDDREHGRDRGDPPVPGAHGEEGQAGERAPEDWNDHEEPAASGTQGEERAEGSHDDGIGSECEELDLTKGAAEDQSGQWLDEDGEED